MLLGNATDYQAAIRTAQWLVFRDAAISPTHTKHAILFLAEQSDSLLDARAWIEGTPLVIEIRRLIMIRDVFNDGRYGNG
jgi:hypothetical protein